MSWRISLLLLFVTCSTSCHQRQKVEQAMLPNESNPAVLLDVEELAEHMDKPGYILVDFRPTAKFIQGHIPHAINIWRSDLEDTSYPYPGMMPTKSQLEILLSDKGVQHSDTLIVYDDSGSCDAARFWWVLNFYGFDQTKILNGGLERYLSKELPLSTEISQMVRQDFLLGKTNPKHYISLAQLISEMESGVPLTIVDCRTTEEYTGQRQKQGAKKAGRIPESISLEWAHAIDVIHGNTFHPGWKLEEIFQNTLPNKNDTIVVYCHSGVRSAHTTFVLTQLLNYKNVRNYEGSWTEWSAHDLPFEKDVATTIFE